MTIYLYVKTHNKTGLKYFGKTVRDPYKYKGSGKRWLSHIKKYGNDVSTEVIKECYSLEELKEWGLYYSNLWNIVESREWANLKPEIGDGAPNGEDWKRIFYKPEIIDRRTETYKKNYYSNPEKQKERSIRSSVAMNNSETKSKHKQSMKSAMNRLSTKEKCSQSQKLAWANPEERKKRLSAQIEAQNRPEMKLLRSGKNSHKYDHTIYRFEHPDGSVACNTRNEFSEKYNLGKGRVRDLINGKVKHYKGWKFISKEERAEALSN